MKDAVEKIRPQELQSFDPRTPLGVTTRMRWLPYKQRAAFKAGNTTILLPRMISSEALSLQLSYLSGGASLSDWKKRKSLYAWFLLLSCPPPDQKCSLQGPYQQSHKLLLTIQASRFFSLVLCCLVRGQRLQSEEFGQIVCVTSGEGFRYANGFP